MSRARALAEPSTRLGEAASRARAGTIVVWVAALVAQRSILLAWGFDGLFYWEETYRLLVAEALVDGWALPLGDLQADPYAGGSLGIALLAMPVVALVGPSLVGLKCVALCWTAVGLAAWLAFVDCWFGRRATHLFGLCFVAAPPLFAIYNLIAMGSHAEVVTLSGLQLLVAYAWIYGSGGVGTLVAWGVLAGLSSWFTYTALLTTAVCLVPAVASGRLTVSRAAVLAAAFAAGLAPWGLSNLATGGAGLEIVATTFLTGDGPRSVSAFVAKLYDTLRYGIAAGLRFRDLALGLPGGTVAIPREIFSHLYLAVFTLAWVAGAWRVAAAIPRGPRAALARPEVAPLLLFPLFVIAIVASNQVFSELANRYSRVPFLAYRVLVPALPGVFFALAFAASRSGVRVRRAVACLVLSLGVVSTWEVTRYGSAARPRLEGAVRETGATAMGHLLHYRHPAALPVVEQRIAALPSGLRAPAYEGLGFSLAYHLPVEASAADLVATVRSLRPRYRDAVLHGIEAAARSGIEQVPPIHDVGRVARVEAAIAELRVARDRGSPRPTLDGAEPNGA